MALPSEGRWRCDLAACTALSPRQRMLAPCPGLGAALPAVLARSVRQRLRLGALCLGRAQKEHCTELPAALVGQVLALASGP